MGGMSGMLALPAVDVMSDTWVAEDGLGRVLPTAAEVGAPRANRTVALFYFLWHLGGPGPFDISKILAQDPHVLEKSASPLLGPVYASHHWGEPLFGYYLSTDKSVYRKHAQMLADAGVDLIVFDVTNGPTYDSSWRALFEAFAEVRAAGGTTPQISFLCPFSSEPPKDRRGEVVRHLWETLYKPGVHPELWFRWKGKPLLMAHPSHCQPPPAAQGAPIEGAGRFADRLRTGHTLGQLFTTRVPFVSVSAHTPTYGTQLHSACTMTLRREGPTGPVVATRRVEDIADNEAIALAFPSPQPAGTYYLELSDVAVSVGWWSQKPNGPVDLKGGAYADGKPCGGYRQFRAAADDAETRRMRDFFTFRRPIPGYGYHGRNPMKGGWTWLEIFPQHVYGDFEGNPEMMSVGVAQNSKPDRICAMSEPGAMGRRWHDGANDPRPETLAQGLNFQEQWNHALAAAPSFLFVTSWNEWWASRFPEWMGWRQPGGVFPDQFDAEHSRDCEPVVGHWGDAYYWQLVANIRRYKGVREIPCVEPRPIVIDGSFADWADVKPEFRDTPDDPVRRDHPGWAKGSRYVDHSGRNDIVAAKVSYDAGAVYFYVRTSAPLTPAAPGDWMRLHLPDRIIEPFSYAGPKAVGLREIELAVPRTAFGAELPDHLDFKWTDNCLQKGDWTDFTLHGDAAPNDRYRYRAVFKRNVKVVPVQK